MLKQRWTNAMDCIEREGFVTNMENDLTIAENGQGAGIEFKW